MLHALGLQIIQASLLQHCLPAFEPQGCTVQPPAFYAFMKMSHAACSQSNPLEPFPLAMLHALGLQIIQASLLQHCLPAFEPQGCTVQPPAFYAFMKMSHAACSQSNPLEQFPLAMLHALGLQIIQASLLQHCLQAFEPQGCTVQPPAFYAFMKMSHAACSQSNPLEPFPLAMLHALGLQIIQASLLQHCLPAFEPQGCTVQPPAFYAFMKMSHAACSQSNPLEPFPLAMLHALGLQIIQASLLQHCLPAFEYSTHPSKGTVYCLTWVEPAKNSPRLDTQLCPSGLPQATRKQWSFLCELMSRAVMQVFSWSSNCNITASLPISLTEEDASDHQSMTQLPQHL